MLVEGGGSGWVGWSRTYLVCCDVVDHFVVPAGKCHGCPSSKWVTVLACDAADYISLCDCHRAAWFILSVEWDGAASEFDGMVVECLLCGGVTDVSDFKVSSVKVVLNDSSYIGLH